MPVIPIDELVFSPWFREHVLANGTVRVFQTHERHPPVDADDFHAPYMWGITELEDDWWPDFDYWLMHWFATGGFAVKLAAAAAVIYILLISLLQRWMRHRERFQLRGFLIIWNAALCLFSVLGTMRSLPEFVDILRREGLEGSLCNARTRYTGAEMWGFLFVMSKVAEMIDTVFIVLRKQKLIFLHWYHHVATMLYTWTFTILDASACGRWFMLMNYAVHAIMYGYYALRASRLISIPRSVNIAITSIQIVQMLIGYAVAGWTWHLKASGVYCEVTLVNLVVCNTMYFTYVLLFGNYFYHVYLRKHSADAAASGKPDADNVSAAHRHHAPITCKHEAIEPIVRTRFAERIAATEEAKRHHHDVTSGRAKKLL